MSVNGTKKKTVYFSDHNISINCQYSKVNNCARNKLVHIALFTNLL